MALKKCKDCGTGISKKAPTCPQCGAPQKKPTSTFTWLVLILVGVIVVSTMMAPDSTTRTQSAPKLSNTELSAKLVKELKTIPVAEIEQNHERYEKLVGMNPGVAEYKRKLDYYGYKLARLKKIEKQFSSWDGSHTTLEKYIKENMNDPGSYEHVETRYKDNDDHILVFTTFRAKNGFGGVVKQTMSARATIDGSNVTVLN